TKTEYGIIAGALAFEIQSIAGNPEQRIEPVDDTCKLRQDLEKPVGPANVGEFVSKDNALAIIGPQCSACRHEYLRAEKAPGHGHGPALALNEMDPALQCQRAGHFGSNFHPRRIGEMLRSRG